MVSVEIHFCTELCSVSALSGRIKLITAVYTQTLHCGRMGCVGSYPRKKIIGDSNGGNDSGVHESGA